jgi:hypothetical protein
MKVSKDRTIWVDLGAWEKGSSIFAMNSDVLNLSDSQIAIGGSDYRISTGKQIKESRVINVSGQIIADDIYKCRARQTEIKHLLMGSELYFLDKYYNKVIHGSVPNVNDSIFRAEANGRVALVNFNITMLDPFFVDLERTIASFVAGDPIMVDYDIENAEPADFTIKFSCNANLTVVNKLIDDLIEFSNPISMNDGDEIVVSTEGSSWLATKKIAGVTTSILGDVKDFLYLESLILTPGENSFTMSAGMSGLFDVEISYYGRTL